MSRTVPSRRASLLSVVLALVLIVFTARPSRTFHCQKVPIGQRVCYTREASCVGECFERTSAWCYQRSKRDIIKSEWLSGRDQLCFVTENECATDHDFHAAGSSPMGRPNILTECVHAQRDEAPND